MNALNQIVTKTMMLNQLNAYKINRNVQIAITTPKMKESRRFRMLIFWIKLKWEKAQIRCHSHLDVHRAAFYLDINGKRLDMSFKRVWKRLNWCLCDIRCSFVSIAMLIWSFTRLCDLKSNKRNKNSSQFFYDWLIHWSLDIWNPKTKSAYPCKCVLSFKYMSRRLRPLLIEMPEPRNSSSRSIRVVWLAWILLNSCL